MLNTGLLTRFQKNPCARFHLHFVRRLPIEIAPRSQTCMHVEPSQTISSTPDGFSFTRLDTCFVKYYLFEIWSGLNWPSSGH